MSRIAKIVPENASTELKPIYEHIQSHMGKIPNIFQHMGQSAPVLQAFLNLLDQTSNLSISPNIRTKIALITAETNKCHYCLSAHTAMAKLQAISDSDIAAARLAQTQDAKETALLKFAKTIVEKRGQLTDRDVEDAKKAGITDKEIVEIIFVVNINMFTNYFNHIVDTEIDFPKV